MTDLDVKFSECPRCTMENYINIKPCPFCGKPVKVQEKGTYGYDLHSYISCCAIMYGDYDKQQELINKWNTRSELK